MFKTVKRIIDWCGEFKGKLYLGFVMTFFSHIFAALPLALAAYTVGLLIESQNGGAAFDRAWIWKVIVLQIALVLLRFLFDYFRARLQEPIGYQLTARDRLAVGDALKRVSLGYFQQVSTGNILNSITTGLSTLEGMGIRMIDNFVGGYLNFLVIFAGLAVCSPVTALIALGAAALSLCFMLVISHYSRVNSPVEAQANRDMTGAVLEYARGLAVVKSFGKSGAAMQSVTDAVKKGRYTDNSNRNDITDVKVVHNNSDLFVYVRTKDNITAYNGADKNWMTLLIGATENNNGFNGYDYIINRSPKTDGTTSIEKSTGGYNWANAGSADYRVYGNVIVYKIPLATLGLTADNCHIVFKVTDNVTKPDDIMNYYVSGDCAPIGRLSYSYGY